MLSRLCFIFALLALGCSNPNERDNPTDPVHVYTVAFSASEATSGTPPAAMSGSYGEVIQLPGGGDLERSGYAVSRWKSDSGSYAIGGNYTIIGNVAMNAEWLPVYTVTFDGNGATGGTPPAAMKVIRDAATPLPYQGTLERTGYVFVGWTTQTSSTYIYNAGSTTSFSSDLTMYAKWLPVYTVTFDGNGATSGTAPAAWTLDSGSVSPLPSRGNLEKAGYIFSGWNTDSLGTGTNYNAGSSYTIANNRTLYAKWLPAYTVTFNTNGATSGTAPAVKMIAKNSSDLTIWLPGGGDLKKGDSLVIGWNTNSSGTGTSYNVGSSYTVEGDITLYAMWISSYYTDTRDGQVYRITAIGSQIWMAENLNYDATVSECNNNSCKTTYGRRYNWSTARSVCPSGWILPSQSAWETLSSYVQSNSGCSGCDATKLKATSGWNWDSYYGVSGNGTDDYGFSALPGGRYNSISGSTGVGNQGYWWSTRENNTYAYSRYMTSKGAADWSIYSDKTDLLSVRCLKN